MSWPGGWRVWLWLARAWWAQGYLRRLVIRFPRLVFLLLLRPRHLCCPVMA